VGPASRRRAVATPAHPATPPMGPGLAPTPWVIVGRALTLARSDLRDHQLPRRWNGNLPVAQGTATIEQFQLTIQLLAHRHLSTSQGELLMHLGQLEPAVLKPHRPVLLYQPCLANRKHLSQIDPTRHTPVQIPRPCRLPHEPSIEGRQELLLKEAIGPRQVADLRPPQDLHQPRSWSVPLTRSTRPLACRLCVRINPTSNSSHAGVILSDADCGLKCARALIGRRWWSLLVLFPVDDFRGRKRCHCRCLRPLLSDLA
jgi:hypothetical protein